MTDENNASNENTATTEKQKDPSVWDEMRRFIDELEVKANLAGKELNERWEAMKPRLQGIRAKMETKTVEARAWVNQELDEIGSEVRRLRDEVVARVKKPSP